MRLVIQRVQHAQVSVDGNVLGKIGKGLLILVGVGSEDTSRDVTKMVDKVGKLRIFEDEQGKTNLSIAQVLGEALIISQFTLYADCRKGNRPSFIQAGSPELANTLYEEFVREWREKIGEAQMGEFGADMKVELLNDGPFTIVLDSENIGQK